MSRNRARETNPLSTRHFKRIIRRDEQTKRKLHSVWGITWNLRGKSRCKLGSASMMAMSYHPLTPMPGERPGHVIELLCVAAQTDPAAGVIHYSDIRMAHDFSRNPHPGASGRILDPREEAATNVRYRAGDRPNASWVRLALGLDQRICLAAEQNWKLPVVPKLPQFLAGYRCMLDAELEITPALIKDIARHMHRDPAVVAQMPFEELRPLAAAHWPELWQAPWTPGNDSDLWVIDAKYVTQLGAAVALFEDFTELMGVPCWNPARDIKAVQISNPVRDCAAAHGIDLGSTLAVIAAGADPQSVRVLESDDAHDFVDGDEEMTPTKFLCNYDIAVEQMLFLRNCIRGSLGSYSVKFSDDDLNQAIYHPDQPLALPIGDIRQDMAQADALKLMRQQIQTRPLAADHVTDEDLIKALENPHEPLYASKMCQIQVLYRDRRIAPEDNFRFTPATLGRDRVYANLWAGCGWSPRHSQLERYDAPRMPKNVRVEAPVQEHHVGTADALPQPA